jgi:hypothetical protein
MVQGGIAVRLSEKQPRNSVFNIETSDITIQAPSSYFAG